MSEATVSLGDLIARLAAELTRLETAGAQLEHLVADLVSAQSGTVPTALQNLDAMVQRLRDLAAVVGQMAPLVPATQVRVLPLAAATRLAHTRTALLGEQAIDQGCDDDDFFDLPAVFKTRF